MIGRPLCEALGQVGVDSTERQDLIFPLHDFPGAPSSAADRWVGSRRLAVHRQPHTRSATAGCIHLDRARLPADLRAGIAGGWRSYFVANGEHGALTTG